MKNPYPRVQLACLLAAACLALAPVAFAVDPPPDGGYANFNTAEGEDALFNLNPGGYNTAIGYRALYSTSGEDNVAVGYNALTADTYGIDNTAVGTSALAYNTSGAFNTALGSGVLFFNTTGGSNTAIGHNALQYNSTGDDNTAVGSAALLLNTTGISNTASGAEALFNNTSGSYNTAMGLWALRSTTEADNNVAMGAYCLLNNTTGQANTAVGVNALFNNTTGRNNVVLGNSAGRNLTTGNYNIDIGSAGGPGDSNTTRIGATSKQTNTYIAGISGVTVATGVGVIVDTTGHLGTVVSSARFKDNIQPLDKTSEAILALQPVTFRYKHELDPDGIPQFGLVAEQVEKVNPDLVARDEQGKAYTVRYEAVNAMLLNEFLKEHRKVETQEATITQLKSCLAQQQSTNAEQQKEIQALTEALKAQATQIQKVSDRLKEQVAPRVVVNN